MKGLEIYPDTLDAQSCNYLINLFNNDDRRTQGKTADGIYEERKKSTDLYCSLDDPQWIEYNKIVAPAVLSMVNKFKYQYQFLNHCAPWQTHRHYNIQYYGDGEGYFLPHCEHSAANPNRMIAWMIYLNTAQCGTEFPYQQIKVRALQGQGAMWSAGWTHPHKGVTPNVGDKYIVTGWCNYYKKNYITDPPKDLPHLLPQWISKDVRGDTN